MGIAGHFLSSGDTTILLVALVAALVNGAIGYGFSTLLVPVALLFYPSKTLNPGLVLAEIVLNLILVVSNYRGVRRVFRRVLPMMLASLPGIALGGFVLKYASSDGLRLGTYALLLPLVLLQAAGLRRPIRAEKLVEMPLGFGIGILYACTTISGPPLGLLFNNQGYEKDDFRSALSLFRVTESVATGIAYYYLSVYTPQSVHVSALILPCIVLGSPLGRLAMNTVDPESFRRICMAFDAWLISFGLSRVLSTHGGVLAPFAYVPMAGVLVLDAVILYRYFTMRKKTVAAPREPATPGLLDPQAAQASRSAGERAPPRT